MESQAVSSFRQAWTSRSSARLRQAAAKFAGRFDESLLLIPAKFSGEFFSIHPRGSAGLHRATFAQAARQFAEPILAQRGLSPVNALGAEAVVTRAVFSARQRGDLHRLAQVAGLPGFARALGRTIHDLRLARIEPDHLEGDLALLLGLYGEELDRSGLTDLAGILACATEAARTGEHPWFNLPVAILDVPLPSLAHEEFARSLLARSPEWVAAYSPGNATWEAICGRAAEDLDTVASPNSLDRLRRSLFVPAPDLASVEQLSDSGTGFEFFSSPGEGLESVEIARRILKLAHGGKRFDECAVLLRNPERYQPMLEDAFRRAGIPAYFSRGSTRPDPAGRAFLALLSCAAENLSASRFAEYMSLGQVPDEPAPPDWVAPQDDLLADPPDQPIAEERKESDRPTPRRWEQYLVDAAVIGGADRWDNRLRGLEAEWALHGQENEERIAQLRNLRAFALPLIESLASLPAAGATWETWITLLRDLAARALRSPDGVLEVLAELAPMSEVGPISLEEVLEVLGDRLRFLRRQPTQRRWGKVFVATIEEARGQEFPIVFLPGLAEGLFPQRNTEDPLLLDDLRREISAHLPTRHSRVDEERERLHLATAAARERLIASYPRMEVTEARPRVPSFYALELPRAITGQLPELSAFEKAARDAAPARLNWPAPKATADAIDDTEYDLAAIASGHAHHVLDTNPHAARSLRARWRRWKPTWKAEDGFVISSAAALDLLAKERLDQRFWSPSALENLAACPYKFALHGIYRLRPREESVPLEQLDPRTRGSLFHEVVLHLYRSLQSEDALPVTPDSLPPAMARLEEVLDRVAKDFADRLVPAIPRVWNSEIEELRTDLRGWLHFTAMNESDWTPDKFEYEIEAEVPALLNVKGRIDVIEKRGNSYRIVDYKTGKAPEMVPRWVGGGKHLQPLLYAIAVEHQMQATVEAGRLLYATQKGGYTPIEIKLDERARLFLGKLLSNIDTMIAGGFLPPHPEKDACKYCDYRVACGPYEEQRAAKKHRDIEELDPFFEIRGMA